jgi:hypothetical protein
VPITTNGYFIVRRNLTRWSARLTVVTAVEPPLCPEIEVLLERTTGIEKIRQGEINSTYRSLCCLAEW